MCGLASSFTFTEAPREPNPKEITKKWKKQYIYNENGGTNKQRAAKLIKSVVMRGATTHILHFVCVCTSNLSVYLSRGVENWWRAASNSNSGTTFFTAWSGAREGISECYSYSSLLEFT